MRWTLRQKLFLLLFPLSPICLCTNPLSSTGVQSQYWYRAHITINNCQDTVHMLTADSWPFSIPNSHTCESSVELHLTAAGSIKMQRLWPLMNISQLAAAGCLDAVHPHWFPCRVKTTLSLWQVPGLSPSTVRHQTDRQGIFLALFQDDSSLAGVCRIPDWQETQRGGKEQAQCL